MNERYTNMHTMETRTYKEWLIEFSASDINDFITTGYFMKEENNG